MCFQSDADILDKMAWDRSGGPDRPPNGPVTADIIADLEAELKRDPVNLGRPLTVASADVPVATSPPGSDGGRDPWFRKLGPDQGDEVRMLRCDKCRVQVHAHCYGVSGERVGALEREMLASRGAGGVALDVPKLEGPPRKGPGVSGRPATTGPLSGWTCERCQVTETDVACALCPRKGGAFKVTCAL